MGLIQDEDVLNSTKIDLDMMARIVAKSGAAVESLQTLLIARSFCEKTVIDIGFLRFPDLKNPFVRVRLEYHNMLRTDNLTRVSEGVSDQTHSMGQVRTPRSISNRYQRYYWR